MPVYEFQVFDGPDDGPDGSDGFWGDFRQEAATPEEAEARIIAWIDSEDFDRGSLGDIYCLNLFAVDGVPVPRGPQGP